MIYTERHIAIVAQTDDPEKRGQIKVKCAAILGTEDVMLNKWIQPCFDWGWFYVPDIDEQVEIEITAGSDTDEVHGQAFLESPIMRYRGKRFFGPDTTVNEMFTSSDYGKRRGFATPGGHVFMFDDAEGGEKINLVWHNSENKNAVFSIDEDGSIILMNANGSQIYLNAAKGEIGIIDQHGNSLSTNSDGVKLADKKGNLVEVNATSGLIQVLAGTIYLGGQSGVEPAMLADQFLTHFRAHIHPTGMGPSGAPLEIPPMSFNSVKSATVQLK